MRSMHGRCMAVGMAALVGVAVQAWGQTNDGAIKFKFGGDERIREEAFDSIPIKADPPGVARGGANDYFRIRTRLWGQANANDKLILNIRATDEFRLWDTPDKRFPLQRSNYNFPDEVVFDTLNLQLRNLCNDNLDLCIGRQDLIYGNGRVILDGTPKDGSRTLYFNAIKATWKGISDTTVDFLGIYNPSKDKLALFDADRDLTGQTSSNDNIDESGGGVYIKNKSYKQLPFEAYGLYKHESHYERAASKDPVTGLYKPPTLAWQTLNAAAGKIEVPPLDLGTVGFRLMPKFNDELSGNLEVALQVGSQGGENVIAYMVDASLTEQLPWCTAVAPSLSAGWYCLSGDDPSTSQNEGWNPLWSRWPQYSELYVYGYDADGAGRWSNLMMPHLDFVMSPAKWLKTTAMGGYMTAPEADGPGGGHNRGWLGVIKGEFTITEKLLTSADSLKGHLWLEVVKPGDYYKVSDTAYFARWELFYTF